MLHIVYSCCYFQRLDPCIKFFFFLVTLKAALCVNVRMRMRFCVKLESVSPNFLQLLWARAADNASSHETQTKWFINQISEMFCFDTCSVHLSCSSHSGTDSHQETPINYAHMQPVHMCAPLITQSTLSKLKAPQQQRVLMRGAAGCMRVSHGRLRH